MTALEVIVEAEAAGVELAVTPGGDIRWRSRCGLPAGLRQLMAANKAGVIDLLAGRDAGEPQPRAGGPNNPKYPENHLPGDQSDPPAPPWCPPASLLPWDQAEADCRLADLRAAMAEAERRDFGGQFPEPLGNVVADMVAVAEEWVGNHEQERARGWDP